MNHPTATICSICIALLALPDGSRGQTFREDISITEVEVPVQVLVDNRAVAGLTQENFILLVDGEPQELTWFQAIELDTEGLATTAVVLPPDAASPTSGRPTAPAAWSRNYLLFFDFAFSSRNRLERAIDGVREMLDSQSHPSDRLSLAFYSQSLGARILVPFTSDREGLELGLGFLDATLDAKSKKSIERLEELDAWWREASPAGALPDPMLAALRGGAGTLIQPIERPAQPAGLGLPIVRRPTDETVDANDPDAEHDYRVARLNAMFGLNFGSGTSEVKALSRSMASLVTLLRDVPEPKHLFYLSEGLGAGLFGGTETRTTVLEFVKPMLDAFRTTGWTLQGIDLTGIAVPPTSVLTGPEDFDGASELRGQGVQVISGFSDDSLFYFANETGGEVYENYNRIHQATEKILERSRVTYLLAFQPREGLADGDRYDIEVRLDPKIRGARILHRPGFRTAREPLDRTLTERRMDAADLALGGEQRADLQMNVLPVVVPTSQGAHVSLFAEVGTRDLDTGRKGKKKARLDIHGYALDGDGEVRGGFARQLNFRLDGEEKLFVASELSLPPGDYELRLLAWDLRSGRHHTFNSRIAVPGTESSIATIVGPYFLDDPTRSRRFPVPEAQRVESSELFELEQTFHFPDSSPTITRGRSRRFLVSVSGGAAAAPSARILEAEGSAARRVELEAVADDDSGRFVGVVDSTELAPGSYRLEVALGNARSTARSTARSSAATFQVVEPD